MNLKSGPRRSKAAATVKFFMFEAGMKYFSESFSKTSLPLASDTIFIPTRARKASEANKRERIAPCRDAKLARAGVGLGVAGGVGEGVGRVSKRSAATTPMHGRQIVRASIKMGSARVEFLIGLMMQDNKKNSDAGLTSLFGS